MLPTHLIVLVLYTVQGSDAVIFVIDSNDRERISEAREELAVVMQSDHLKDAVLLVMANKQDLPNSMTCAQVAEGLQLAKTYRNIPWHVQACVATSGSGLYEGESESVYYNI
jgi:signal recognition particle receptor subunit beta